MVDKRILGMLGLAALALAAVACGGGEAPPAESLSPLERLEQTVRDNPDDLDTLHVLAVALHKEGRREESLGYFERLVEGRPETRHLIELGVAYASLHRPDDAEGAFKRALETSIGNPVALHHLANLARSRGDVAEAISLYRQAVESDPEYLMAHFHLAEALKETQQFKEAYQSYENVVNLQPKVELEMQAFDSSLLHMAGMDLQMGASERAIELLQVLVEAVPDHPTAHMLLGQALMTCDRQDEARSELEIHQRLAAEAAPPEAGTPPAGQ